MYNCIFSAHCTELTCDNSCPTLVETSYLLERNGISMKSPVFASSAQLVDAAIAVLNESAGKFKSVVSSRTVEITELLTYCAICQNWQGSRLHCNVYNLRYSKYIEELKKSWTTKAEPESLEYMRIWANSAKVLIISHIDYVNFGDFESQTILNLLQSRQGTDQTTILVTPDTKQLVGKSTSSQFFAKLTHLIDNNRASTPGCIKGATDS